MATSWAVIWDSVCDFLHGKSQALSEASAVKPAIRGSPTYSQLFTAQSKTTSKPFRIIMGKSEWFSSPWVSRRFMGTRLKSCPDTKQSFFAACEGDTLPVCFLLERAPPLDGYYSCPVDEPHLWEALRYTELNPVRASLVAGAECWDWSSAAAHCGRTRQEHGWRCTCGVVDGPLSLGAHVWMQA
jgi:hypothetical protein